MDFLPLVLPTNTIATTILVALLFYICLRILTSVKKSKTSPPQARGAWPLVGHLHLLRGPQAPHITLGKLADKYGPIFTIKLGVHPTLVISNSEITKECLTKHDKALAGRPKTVAMEIMGYNHAMLGFTPYGPYWRRTRMLATVELLSNQRLETFKHIRESEIKNALKEMYQSWVQNKSGDSNHVLVNMTIILGDMIANVIYRMVVGKVYASKGEGDVRWKQVVWKYIELLSNFGVGDALPFLRWLDWGGVEKTMRKAAKELDIYVEEWLEEHKKKRSSSGDHGRIVDQDFMDVMLSIFEDDKLENFADYSPHTINKAMCLTIILAGSDTTKTTLTWALSLLFNHPEALKKVQQELAAHVGPETLVNESDVKSFVYLEAVIKEVLRLYPPGPLAIPHESMEDCNIAGYHVSVGTRIFFNLWKIHQDPHVWENPSEFKPERFLTTHKDLDVRGRQFEFLPFGSQWRSYLYFRRGSGP